MSTEKRLPFLRNIISPEDLSLRRKLTRNVVYGGVRLLLLAPLPFLVIPYVLKKLGPVGYGTWAMFVALSGLTSLVDVGLVITLSKHVAQFYALKDMRSLSRIVNTGFALYLAIACGVAIVLWTAAPLLLLGLFRGSSLPTNELHHLWLYLILWITANVVNLFLSSLVNGLQRMDLTTGLTSFTALSSACLSIVLLSQGFGIRGLMYAYVIAAWATLCIYVYVTRRLLPDVRFDPRDCNWIVAKDILGFSVKTYVTQVAVAVHNQIDKFYLARFVGVVSVGWYDIASDVALKCRAIPGLVLGPLLPAAAELDARDDQRRLAHLYHRSHKYLAFIGVPLVTYIAFTSKRLVNLWLGHSFEFIAVPLSVLLVVNFANLITGPGYFTLVARNKLAPGLYSALLGIVLNVFLSLGLILSYGFQGAVAGTSLSLLGASAFFIFLFQREMGGSFFTVFRSAYLKPIASSLVVVTLLWIATRSEPSSWGRLILWGAAFAIAYVLLLLAARHFDTVDLLLIEHFVPFPRMARRLIPHAELGGPVFSDPERIETSVG